MSRLAEVRKANGYTQAKLAKHLGVARSTVSMWESSTQEPDWETMSQIADLFNVSVDYLLGREEKAPDTAEAASGDVSEVEKELIRCAGQLTGEQKGFLLTVARSLLGQGQAPRPDPPGTADGTA